MSSIATAVFQATIGLLINKARDTAAEKLKEGDVTDEKFRTLIVREIDQINSKLDGLARKDLLSSISAFKEGIAILFDVFDKENKGVKELSKENATGPATAAGEMTRESAEVRCQFLASAQAKTVSLANKLANLQLIDFDESSKELLSDAKRRFKEARSKARDAFCNESLDTSDRIQAMMIRVMATILEKVDNPVNAITPCRVCLEELHALSAVKKSFSIALAKEFKSRFNKDEREAIIAAVCDINHAIFDVTLMVGSDTLIWSLIDVGAENVHLLRDSRVAEINQMNTQYIGFYPKRWSFGAGILKSVSGICTNTKGQFIVGDWLDENIKVFDCDGNFLYLLSATLRNTTIYDVATDQADNIYVLCQRKACFEYHVRVFDKDSNMHRSFGFNDFIDFDPSRLSVVEEKSKPESKRLFVLGLCSTTGFVVKVVEIPDSSLQGEEFVWRGCCGLTVTIRQCLTVCDNGNVIAVNELRFSSKAFDNAHVFSAKGVFLHKFSVFEGQTKGERRSFIQAIHWANEHLVVVSTPTFGECPRPFLLSFSWDFDVSIYKEDGKLVQHFSVMTPPTLFRSVKSITMNRQGRIALSISFFGGENDEILVI